MSLVHSLDFHEIKVYSLAELWVLVSSLVQVLRYDEEDPLVRVDH